MPDILSLRGFAWQLESRRIDRSSPHDRKLQTGSPIELHRIPFFSAAEPKHVENFASELMQGFHHQFPVTVRT